MMGLSRLSLTTLTPRARVLLGMVFMVGAASTIPLVDGIAKHLTATYAILFISWARCVSGAVLILPFGIAARHQDVITREVVAIQIARAVLILIAMTFYFAAIRTVSMADALGAYFISPIVVTILSALILKERLNAYRVGAVLLGFLGVLLVVRPSPNMDIGMLYAVASGSTFACYVLLTRVVNRSASTTVTLSFQYVLGALILTPFVWQSLSVPTWTLVGLIALMGLFSVISHALEVTALRFAEASVVSPLMYSEIVSATLVGYFAFGDFPDSTSWLGIVIVIATGIVLLREGDGSHRAPPPLVMATSRGEG